MATEFKPIMTQEDFDAAIQSRLERERNKWQGKYAGYCSPEDVENIKADLGKENESLKAELASAAQQIADSKTQIAERDKQLRTHEINGIKSRVAHEAGLSYEAISFLQGETEDDIKSSADSLKALMGNNRPTAPLATTEHTPADGRRAALATLATSLTEKGQ